MSTFSLALLGAYTATLAERSLLPFRTNRVQALLAYLALENVANPGVAHRRERLMELLWPGLPAVSSRDNLRVTLYRLRQAVPQVAEQSTIQLVDFVLADRQSIQINPRAIWQLDVAQFQQRLAGKPALVDLEQTVILYRGDFLNDFYLPDSDEFETWAANWRALLQRQMLAALDTLTSVYLVQGDYTLAETFARRQLAIDNLRESAHRQLMEALFQQGKRNEAFAHYDSCRRLLWSELGVEPAPETLLLFEVMRTGQLERKSVDPPIVTAQVFPPALPTSPPHNLPQHANQFIGRAQELVRLDELIATNRLITIVGVGGMGKTRLALAVAEHQWQRTSVQIVKNNYLPQGVFPDGIYFVGLEALNNAAQIVFAIAQALDFPLRGEQEPIQQLLNYLRRKRLLLVLDNFEHLVDGVNVLSAILTNVPGIQLLITSRERLGTPEEQLFPLTGLECRAWSTVTEAEQFASVQLFMQCARRNRPDFALNAADLPALVQICQCVGGMPLGLELAATWTDTLPLAEIATQLQRNFDLLETTLQRVPDRQRSIRAVFDATWERLGEMERTVFAQLACFLGGFTRPAVQQVLSSPLSSTMLLRNLAELVRKALVQFDAGHDRYFIHELLRQYGEEQLRQQFAQEVVARDRHSAFYCAWLKQREAALKGAREQAALAEIEMEIGNIRTAGAWAVEQRQAQHLYQASEAFALYAEYVGLYREAEAAFSGAVIALRAHNTESSSTIVLQSIARLLSWQAPFARRQGHFAEANALLQEAEHLLDDLRLVDTDTCAERAFIYWHKAMLAFPYGKDHTAAKQYYIRALELYRLAEDSWGIANTLEFLGELEGDGSNLIEWHQIEDECLAIRQQTGNLRGIANSLHQVAFIDIVQGNWAKAEQLMRQSLALHQQIRDRVGETQRLSTLGVALLSNGKFTEAQVVAQQALTKQQELGDPFWLAMIYSNNAFVELHLGNYAQAALLAQKSLQVQQEQDANQTVRIMGLAWTQIAQRQYQVARETIQKAQLSKVTTVLFIEQTFQIQQALAIIHYHQENFYQSQQYIINALAIILNTQHVFDLLSILSISTVLMAAAGQKLRQEIASVAHRSPFFLHSQWFKDCIWTPLAELTADLSPAEVEEAKVRGQKLDSWTTARQLLQELLDLGWPQPETD